MEKMCKPTPIVLLPQKNCPIVKILTRRLPTSSEGLNSSLAQSTSKLWWFEVAQSGIQSMSVLYTGSEHVKKSRFTEIFY